ncbi:S8 family serine peptidase [Azonexus fungiphilus]|uniref:S8 family serine peptidase n=1 Tax=Azonexus fungiphilus TaxID=146940 RepID=UPI00156A8A1B|nr:S8 family serine peptidase [Azonexus fungiphilus]NHC07623.1 autotransporter domain-containing protein [Azonexus fungiphilus]
MKSLPLVLALSVLAPPAAAQFVPGPEFYNQPALSAINLLPAYAAGLSGAGVRVGVVDSGINPGHVEFANAILAGYNSYTNRAGNSDFASFLQDYYNHGTLVASVIAARLDGADRASNMQGVAYRAGLVIGAMNFVADEQVNAGYMATSLDYVSAWSTKVINNSWEFASGAIDPTLNYQSLLHDYPIVISAIDGALARGSVLVFAAGNETAANPGTPAIVPAYDSAIAARGGFIVVAATNNAGTALATYSNRCGVSKEYCMAAPGGDFVSGTPLSATAILGADSTAREGYFHAMGTSAAAPFVSGAVALVAEQFPWMSNKNLAVTVLTTANRAANPDVEWGRGLLDVGKAIRGPGLFEEDFAANLPAGYSSTFSNDIGYRPGLNGGLIKLGDGTLALSGISSYTGNTVVDGGTLVVNGSLLSPVTVGAAGTLRGTGNLSGELTVNGVLAPGDPVGELTVGGNLTMGSTARFHTGVASASAFGKLDVVGSAALPDNARIVVQVLGTGYNTAGRLEDVIRAGTLIGNGSFSVTDNSLLFNFFASQDGNTVDLLVRHDASVDLQALVSNAGKRSARSAARAIDRELAGDPASRLGEIFGGFTDGQESLLAQAISQTLPLLSGETSRVAQSVMGYVGSIVQTRRDDPAGLPENSSVDGDREMWLRPFGTWAEQKDRGGVPGYDVSTGGMVLGTEAAVSAASRLGLAFAYASSRVQGGAAGASHHAEMLGYQLLGYGSHALDADSELSFQAGFGRNATEGRRHIPFASGTALAKYHSLTASAGIGWERRFELDEKTSFLPSIRADYRWIRDGAYREKGPATLSPLLLDVAGRVSEELMLGLNGRMNYRLNASTALSVNLGVAYDAINGNAPVRAAYAAAPEASFATHGIDRSPWQASGGLSLVHRHKSGAEIKLRYDAESRRAFRSHAASAVVRWVF